MSIERRDILKGALAALSTAFLPFSRSIADGKGPVTIARPEASRVIPFAELPAAEKSHAIFDSNWAQNCIVGIKGRHSSLLAKGVTITYPTNPEQLHSFPCEIVLHTLVGPYDQVTSFLHAFSDIANQLELVVYVRNSDNKNALLYTRPVMLSTGPMIVTRGESFDVYGINGGDPIPVPASARMALAENVKLMCVRAPSVTSLDTVEAMSYRDIPKSPYDLHEMMRLHEELYAKMTPAERLAYDAKVRKASDGNKDLSAWGNCLDASDPLKGHRERLAQQRGQDPLYGDLSESQVKQVDPYAGLVASGRNTLGLGSTDDFIIIP